MLHRKYMYMIAKAIGRSHLTKKQRGSVAYNMLDWMLQDNPAMNVKAFRILSRTESGVIYDETIQNNDTSTD